MSQLYVEADLLFDTDYSTSEVKTGATWIDGKPIYRKVIDTTTIGKNKTGTNRWIYNAPFTIDNKAFTVLINCLVHIQMQSGDYSWVVPAGGAFSDSTGYPTQWIGFMSESGFTINSRPSFVTDVDRAIFTVFYTKTTD